MCMCEGQQTKVVLSLNVTYLSSSISTYADTDVMAKKITVN